MAKLRSVGFLPVANWESMSVHKDLQVLLSVYVGDFKTTGPIDNMKKAWSRIHDVIVMDDPTSLGKYLGRAHGKLNSVSHVVVKAPMRLQLPLGAGGDSMLRRGSYSWGDIPGVRYEMSGIMEQCVGR